MAGAHREHDIADPEGLQRTVESLAGAPALAVDVETNAMHAYRASLCFVQLATEEDIFVVDTLAPGVSAGALAARFFDPSIRKVFHDAQGDLRTLAREGIVDRNLFDTHRAATLLGLPKVGLGDLVETRFGVKLMKEHQTSDFGKRPLPAEVRAYVADDVRYLLPLARQLADEARAAGIEEELELEFERLAAEGVEPETPPRARLPGGKNDALTRAVAALAETLRHRQAETRNVPVGRVLPNAAVVEIAVRKPATAALLARIPGVKGSFVREVGEELLTEMDRLRRAAEKGELSLPEEPKARKHDRGKRERETALKAWRAEAAKARGVTPSVVLPTYIVEDLAADPPADLEALGRTPWLGDKRLSLYGVAVLGVLSAAAKP